jgi:hypothetical protein
MNHEPKKIRRTGLYRFAQSHTNSTSWKTFLNDAAVVVVVVVVEEYSYGSYDTG